MGIMIESGHYLFVCDFCFKPITDVAQGVSTYDAAPQNTRRIFITCTPTSKQEAIANCSGPKRARVGGGSGFRSLIF